MNKTFKVLLILSTVVKLTGVKRYYHQPGDRYSTGNRGVRQVQKYHDGRVNIFDEERGTGKFRPNRPYKLGKPPGILTPRDAMELPTEVIAREPLQLPTEVIATEPLQLPNEVIARIMQMRGGPLELSTEFREGGNPLYSVQFSPTVIYKGPDYKCSVELDEQGEWREVTNQRNSPISALNMDMVQSWIYESSVNFASLPQSSEQYMQSHRFTIKGTMEPDKILAALETLVYNQTVSQDLGLTNEDRWQNLINSLDIVQHIRRPRGLFDSLTRPILEELHKRLPELGLTQDTGPRSDISIWSYLNWDYRYFVYRFTMCDSNKGVLITLDTNGEIQVEIPIPDLQSSVPLS